MNWLIFDVETTGFDYKSEFVISIGAILWNDQDDSYDEFYELLDWTQVPDIDFKIPESSFKVHGINVETLKMDEHSYHPAYTIVHMYEWVQRFVSDRDDKCIGGIVAFNSSFDVNMMRSNLQWLANKYVCEEGPGGGYHGEIDMTTLDIERLNHILAVFTKRNSILFIDSMTLDRIFHYEEDGIKVLHNLEDVGNRYGLDPNEHAHNAMYDTRRLADVFKMQIKELKQMGIPMDGELEKRIVHRWNIDQKNHGNHRKSDYYGLEMTALEV